MRRHDIFTLGIILSSIYGINAVADWPTIPADDIWTNPERTTLANQRCRDCCKTDCWLPDGTYYDNVGTFTETCTGEPSEPTCDSNATYSIVDGQCKGKLNCPSGTYDIGFSSCIDADTNGIDYGYWDFGGNTYNTDTYGLTAGGQWGATLYTGDKITGIASCNNTKGTNGVATDTEFSNTADGQYCWCKMTSPAVSRWVLRSNVYTADSCASNCARYCGFDVRYNFDVRSGVFGSVE